MEFGLSPAQQSVVDNAKQLVKECKRYEETWPLSEFDIEPHLATEIRARFIALGLNGLAIPREAGGRGVGTVAKALAFEELQQSPVLRGMNLTWPWLMDPPPALYSAPVWQRDKYLYPVIDGRNQYHICLSEPDYGSDAAGIELKAERRGEKFVLNGFKRWPPDPGHYLTRPDYLVVYAVTDPGKGYRGITTFLVDYPSPGVRVLKVVETEAAGTFLGRVCDYGFTDVEVPAENILGEENAGFRGVQDLLNRNRVLIAANAVGDARRALQMALAYAQERRTFGKLLMDHQAIQLKLAEMATDIETTRMVTLKAAWMIDQGAEARLEAAMAKSLGPRMAANVIDRTIQILGGIGCLKTAKLGESWFFNRMGDLAEGSVEMMKISIFRAMLAQGVRRHESAA
jgi:alkylation response protein AidB-like acyl-CoA dehydrogenase